MYFRGTKMTQKENIERFKELYIEYYKELPVQKYACMSIGKDEATIIRWKQKDANFASRVDQARAEWVKKKASKAKVEFALERLEKSVFRESVENTGEITHKFEELSDEELDRAIKARQNRLSQLD